MLHETCELRKDPKTRRAEQFKEAAQEWVENNTDVVDELLSFKT